MLATKLDKIPRGKVMNRIKEIRSTLAMPEEETITPISTVTKQGVDQVWSQIKQITGVLVEM